MSEKSGLFTLNHRKVECLLIAVRKTGGTGGFPSQDSWVEL